MLRYDGRVGQQVAEISSDGSQPGELARILRHPASAIVTDAEDVGRGSPHPAHAGAFTRALRWNREHGWLDPEALVRKMTRFPAERVGLKDRGRIEVGYAADLVLFDPERVSDRASWEQPRLHSIGVHTVLINGQVVISKDTPGVSAQAGQVLRSTASAATSE